ncbi:efflux RND transporter permease subunit [Jeotgalibacillus haloalkalitolerans]|uniref:Efflux RND transporter permease subunit n=1 Tax=Jeotgalibacillus haloalkalitolerans TaxID=3104292 RepID=A0ABU5KQQ2_9BACL|nr:efflux RND transporter permease subunit [Jeotgalibacillus sp. HH7-29]MDZ5713572.1 efflux RND transporter permease subunit [Jeotgalibacillus sp. HH7-29]
MFEWVLKRSKIFMILFVLFLIVGVLTFLQLPQREIPETSINISTISTPYPGATPETVERTVTNPIERNLDGLDGIDSISSSSAAGFSQIIVTLTDGADKQETLSAIRQEVSDAGASFPEEVIEPTVSEAAANFPVTSYMLTADSREDFEGLRSVMDTWEEELSAVPGISGVTVKGVQEEEIILTLNSEDLGENGLAFPQVLTAIEEEFNPVPLGKQEADGTIYQLAIESYSSVDEMEQVVIGQNPQGESVLLSDVGTVEIQPKQTEDLITFDGQPAVSVTTYLESGEDIPSVSEAVEEKVAELKSLLPENITFESYYSQANLVNEIFQGLFFSLAIAVLAVIVTSSLGLTAGGAIVVAIAVPMSVLMGIIPLPGAGVDLNQISVIGVIIALGILVDDSIVVNDNIQRRFKLGDKALPGVVTGVKEVWVSIVTSSLAIVFTFLPLVFLSGGNGDFIRALPTVLITTIIASTIVALLLVPMLRYSFYRNTSKKVSDSPGLLGKPLNFIADFYADKVLKRTAKKPLLTGAIGLIITTLLFGLVVLTPFEFFPAADREEVTVDVTLPIGTPLEETENTLLEIAEVLEQDEGVYETSVFAGTGLPNLFNSSLDTTGDYTGQIVARVDRENQTAQGLIEDYTDELRSQYPDAIIFMNTIEQGPPSGAPVTVTVKGPELEELVSIRDEVMTQIEDLGVDLVLDNIGEEEPVISYVPDRGALEENDISIQAISQQIRLVTEGIPMASFDDGVTERDMKLLVDPVEEGQEIPLDEIEVPAASQQEGPPQLIPLSDLITAEETSQLQRIQHEDGERAITIRAFPGEVEDLEAQTTDIVEDIRSSLGDDYSLTIGGENEAQDDFFSEIILLFTIVIFLVYLLIAFQFNSLSLPFLVLTAVYLAIAGAILGLFVTQTPISFLAVMGMVSLTGIVVRNSVVLIDFIEQGVANGMKVYDAVIEAGRVRIRPIILTAVTSIVALIPVAVSGDALFTPLAITIIAGIAFSTLLTLIIVPMLYLVFLRFRRKGKELKKSGQY